ncbi:uncharacterized protein LOC125771054 [Anopheles funestus]|uniref:uncharacterized protein LOC125771054 n=1 Tax=Anopheles funestus TaxID=62324 RepID=UPI0020C5C5D8|nr:uncharacterized protein LOC125771054 [Anopheles funestus]XP_049297203.1 uncharacterized protein LOC125771054 [Anopheles funestus]
MVQSDYLCRVCMGKGVWNIFSINAINDELCTAASINYIRDKLQYVTELQLHEDDGLPLRICELCIIQLNVAYRFKQLAIESDCKLRQSLEARARTPALTNDEHLPEVQAEPEIVMIKDETLDEITIEPTTITEERFASPSLPNNAIVPNEFPAEGMVYLHKDVIDPAEDEIYLKDIVKKEVITMPWPITNEETTDTSALPSIPPEQCEQWQKPAKSSHKRKRSKTSLDELENELQNDKKEVQKETTSQQTYSHNGTSSSAESAKNRTKPTKAELRKKRLKKVLDSLRIDMVYNPMERYSLKELETAPNAETPSPKMIMKRRNSVCVSSFKPWI